MIRELDTSAIVGKGGLTPEHLERRRGYITASDFPAILGLDPHKTAADVYLEKVGALAPSAAGEPAAIGTGLEPAILDMAESVVGKITDRQRWYTYGVLGATLDGVAKAAGAVVNAKTSGRVDDWVDEPPPRVVVQVHAEMICSTLELAYVPVILPPQFRGPLRFRVFEVRFDRGLADALASAGEKFMRDNVGAQVMPAGQPPHIETLNRMVRSPGKVALVDDRLMAAFAEAREARLEADREAKVAAEVEHDRLRFLVAAMGDAEAAQSNVGTFSWLLRQRKGYTVEPGEYRVSKFTPAKEQQP